ncbi:hypothetical protein CPB83DRAFT_843591 [Crepidotus variabilis]|uniref:Uncharacterized protein n=1 Tax=Crepidotus variabilis TaxID=179855 RepID=A0A9P6ETU0_9AGAR|nr:hypothetical protein CPB83DRAFT_843591 [Crepidotus variabilis]
MPTAEGNIRHTSGGRLNATFNVGGINYHFSGAFTSSVQPFNTNNASVTYTDVRALTNTRTFFGRIGPDNIQLTLQNSVSIQGTLDFPIFPGASVSGSGVWGQNFDEDSD